MQKELLSVLGNLLTTAVSNGNKQQGKIESRIVQVDSGEFNYQIYIPPQIQSEQNLPVIIFLHGIGQRGSGGILPTEGTSGGIVRHYFAQVPAIVLLPQCRQGSYWTDPVMDEMVINALAQTIEEFGADVKRIYLIGVSMGGYGVWHFASHYSGTFAALVSICGGSPIRESDRFDSIAGKVGETPSWIFHGADDRVVPVSESRQIVKALEANGSVKYNEYAGVGHSVWLNVLGEKDLLPWLLAQRQSG
ncbi:MAG: dienelactone hydrolase family protein [Acidobacteriota bacterium]|nr:dienelactone hydrolase family protein [Acidobacteriota bacterium]